MISAYFAAAYVMGRPVTTTQLSLLDLVYGFWVLCMSATASVFISKAGGTASTSRQ